MYNRLRIAMKIAIFNLERGEPMKQFMAEKIDSLSTLCEKNFTISSDLYSKYNVKKGLRDINGKGVVAGLTQISDIKAYDVIDGVSYPCEGELLYRGVDIQALVGGFIREQRKGYEETAYLLLFGELPTKEELVDFQSLLAQSRTLPKNFVRDIVMKAPSKDMMNTLAKSVLMLAAYDSKADDTSIANVLRQSIQLISIFPMIAVYGYHAYNHYVRGKSFYIHNPKEELSTAENILRMLRPDKSYTELEVLVLDLALILHMEHGGGNNSTFTTRVVSSSGTDTYSSVAAALGSLKGPKHGGANYKVVQMMEDLKKNVKDHEDRDEVASYLTKLLRKEAFDKQGLIYGMGHAVYSISDPRAQVFKSFVKKLSEEKGRIEEFKLFSLVENLAPEVIAKERTIYKGVSANVDFYSGCVYYMLNIPPELYTPIFAMGRIVGWSAHRMEELINVGKIIRPAYQSLVTKKEYMPLEER